MDPDLHRQMMLRAIELSRGGFPAPNPRVGCVIAQGSEIVGEGWHDYAGGPHAEAVALARAGERARGADVYVTLEPCRHTGRTPPCADALIAAGIKRVFVACPDPNPIATGGATVLREAGIEVHVGEGQTEAEDVNHVFLHAFRTGRPWVAVKVATTLDGYLARPDGTSQWITGPEAREEGHRLRAEMGSVLVGRATVAIDNPQLTARIPGVVNQPQRIVLDPDRALTGDEDLFPGAWRVVRRPAASDQEISLGPSFALPDLLTELKTRGLIGVLVEGGAHTVREFLRQDLVDELHVFSALKVFGEGRSWLGSGEWSERFRLHQCRAVGEDCYSVWRRTSRE